MEAGEEACLDEGWALGCQVPDGGWRWDSR